MISEFILRIFIAGLLGGAIGLEHEYRAKEATQVVSGIGFIGASCIIFQKHAVRGLTTAAGLWVAAAIGMAAGAGMYAVAVAATLMVIICLELMNFLHRHISPRRHEMEEEANDASE